MPLTGTTYLGWEIEGGEAIVINGEEVTVSEVNDGGGLGNDILVTVIDEMGDYDYRTIYTDQSYAEWGY